MSKIGLYQATKRWLKGMLH